MKKRLIVGVLVCGVLGTGSALAAPGQYWEITSRVEMAGMPFAMPETTSRICIPAGGENDPRTTAKGDDNCEMTDVVTAGNTTRWKMRCDNNGDIMTGEGEMVSSGDSYRGTTRLTGTMEGQPVEMTQSYSGRKTGGACDSEALPPAAAQARRQMEQSCDLANYTGDQLVYAADLFLGGQEAMCADRRPQYCEALRGKTPVSKEIYTALVRFDGGRGAENRVAVLCNVDTETARQALCAASATSDYAFLEGNCPAEAKAYLEAQRRTQQAGGRAYTSSGSPAPGLGDAAGTVLDSAKKLKGIFGF
ncbi:MAG: DUF3617 family protein [Thermodesulfobacteriota bacterium]